MEPLTFARATPELRLSGRMVDIQPLLEQHANYLSAQADLTVAGAALELARKSKQRLSMLHRESIVATRELIQAEAQFIAETARVQAARVKLEQVRENILQTWGADLLQTVLQDSGGLFDRLLRRAELLGVVSLSTAHQEASPGLELRILPAGQRGDGAAARLLGPAPHTDPTTQGETWYFTVPAQHLRTGMRVDAWMKADASAVIGVSLPVSAIVWQAGSPWVYVKSGEGEFTRKPIGPHQEWPDHWQVADGFEPGEEVAVVGAQMLMSEELRRHIPGEDDD